MGIYSVASFWGLFAGGMARWNVMGKTEDVSFIYICLALLTMLWVTLALFMRQPCFYM